MPANGIFALEEKGLKFIFKDTLRFRMCLQKVLDSFWDPIIMEKLATYTSPINGDTSISILLLDHTQS